MTQNTKRNWRILSGTESLAAGRENLLTLTEMAPNNPDSWVQLGWIELDLEMFQEAISHYKRAAELSPNDVNLWIWLANAYDRASDLPGALKNYEIAESLNPSNAELFYERGLAYRNHKMFANARRNFLRAYELDPSRVQASELARMMVTAPYQELSRKNRGDEKKKKLLSAVAKAETNEDYGAVIVLYDELLADSPENVVYWSNRGWANLQREDFEAALHDFEKSVQINPEFLQAWVNLGATLKVMVRLKEAKDVEAKIVALDPSFAAGHYNLSVSLFDAAEFDQALLSIDRAIALDDKDSDYFVLRNRILAACGRSSESDRRHAPPTV